MPSGWLLPFMLSEWLENISVVSEIFSKLASMLMLMNGTHMYIKYIYIWTMLKITYY